MVTRSLFPILSPYLSFLSSFLRSLLPSLLPPPSKAEGFTTKVMDFGVSHI